MILIGIFSMAIFLDVLGMYFLEPNILVNDAHIPSSFFLKNDSYFYSIDKCGLVCSSHKLK